MALTPREMRFLAVYLAQESRNGAQAYREAISAKAAPTTAATAASKILAKADVAMMVTRFDERLTERLVMGAEDLTRMWSSVITTDRNELSELIRVPCRYCHSENDFPQETRHERATRKREFDRRQREITASARPNAMLVLEPFDEMGGIGYSERKPINPDCDGCHGRGEERVIFKDTTKLSPAARAVFEGVKQTRDGLEVKMYSRADAAAALAKRWGIGGGDPKPPAPVTPTNVTPRDPVEASRNYARIMNGDD